MMFVAMTSPSPACPKCGSLKNEDYGDTTFALGQIQEARHTPASSAAREVNQRSDANLRRIADRYDLTNMNNKDGQAVKRAPRAPVPSDGRMTTVGGYQVPENTALSAGCHRLPITAKLKGPQIQEINTNKSPMLKGMTRVAYEHKGKI